LAEGALEEATSRQGQQLGDRQPCPQCGRLCTVTAAERPLRVKGAVLRLREPKGHCPTCRRDFFPQRPLLKLDEHGYSPTTLYRILYATAEVKSHHKAAKILNVLDDLSISGRHVNRLAEEIGLEMAARRDRQTEDFVHHRRQPPAAPAPEVVAIGLDGGRVLTRTPDKGPGVHGQAWKEDKLPATDPREVLRRTLGYLRNNHERMNHPAYRQPGLPVTSSMVES
jgi:hypothetical protein